MPNSVQDSMPLRQPHVIDPRITARTTSVLSPSGAMTAGILSASSYENATYTGDRRLSVNVTRKSLTNATGNGLTRNMLSLLRLPARVSVEATTHDRADSVFYAPFPAYFVVSNGTHGHSDHPDIPFASPHRPTATEFLTVNPHTDRVDNLVSYEDDFELSFVGMNVPPQHSSASNPNELLLYSLRSNVYPDGEDDDYSKVNSPMFNSNSYHPHDSVVSPSMSLKRNSLKSALGISVPAPSVAEASILTHVSVDSPPGAHLLPTDVAFIHYDPVVDGHNEGSLPDTFLPVPASKAVIRQHRAFTTSNHDSQTQEQSEEQRTRPTSSSSASLVTVRFTVMEVDKVTSAQALTLASLSHMSHTSSSGYTGPGGIVVPYANLISSAVQVANTIGRRALRKYARSDHVMSKDMEFRLVPKAVAKAAAHGVPVDSEQPGVRYAGTYLRVSIICIVLCCFFTCITVFLLIIASTNMLHFLLASMVSRSVIFTCQRDIQYGYYFFLRDKVEAKLYAQTDASSQNVPLLMRRQNYTARMAARGEKEFFPLTGVSYVVMKVSPGCTHVPRDRMRALVSENRVRLEHLLRMHHALEMLADMK